MKKIVLFILLMLPVAVSASDWERRVADNYWDVLCSEEKQEAIINGIIKELTWVSFINNDYILVIPATVKVGDTDYKVVKIADNAFRREKESRVFRGVIIGENVRVIGKTAFFEKDLSTIEFQGNSLEEIGDGAFYGKIEVEKIILPSSIKRIGRSAFCGPDMPGYGVKDFYCYAIDPPVCGDDAFYAYKDPKILRYFYVPKESIDKYKEVLNGYGFYVRPLPETAGIDDKKMSVSESDNHRVICQGNTIIISGTTIGDPVSIYNLAGQRLYTSVCDKGTTTISIPFFDRNLVVIKVGKKIIKCNLK